jgi:hypothetical protein
MVLAALVAAVGGIVVALIQAMRKENRQDHDLVTRQLGHLFRIALRTEDKVAKVGKEVNDHLRWHQGGTDGDTEGRDRSGSSKPQG